MSGFRRLVVLLLLTALAMTSDPSAQTRKIYWGDDGLALVKESWWKTRKTRTWQIAPGTGAAPTEGISAVNR